MVNPLRKILGKTYHPLNKITVSQKNLLFNYQYLSSINNSIKVCPVLKSNAYGHGTAQVAKVLDHVDAPFLCVDSLYEAYELLKVKVKTPVLIMGYIDPVNLKVKRLPFSYAVYDPSLLEVIDRYQHGAGIHIKVDTGMHRLGIPINELDDFLNQLKKFKNIHVEGLMSHFADADNPNDDLTQLQINNFKKAIEILAQNGFNPKWKHIANSDGLLDIDGKLLSDISNMARVGIASYGIHSAGNTYSDFSTSVILSREDEGSQQKPKRDSSVSDLRRIPQNDSQRQLKPVLTLTSQIVQIKTVNKGERVGYGGTFSAKSGLTLAILPIGYNDGVDRRLSNIGFVTINGVACPIVGRVSMNITAVDISKVKNAKVGQEVVVFSDNPSDPNSIENAAKLCDTIPYDLLVKLHPSIRRETI